MDLNGLMASLSSDDDAGSAPAAKEALSLDNTVLAMVLITRIDLILARKQQLLQVPGKRLSAALGDCDWWITCMQCRVSVLVDLDQLDMHSAVSVT